MQTPTMHYILLQDQLEAIIEYFRAWKTITMPQNAQKKMDFERDFLKL